VARWSRARPLAHPGRWPVAALSRFEAALPSVEPGFDVGQGQYEAFGRDGFEVSAGQCPRELRHTARVHYLGQHLPCAGESGRCRLAVGGLSVVLLVAGQSTYALADQDSSGP
jgi:hypothetical protein